MVIENLTDQFCILLVDEVARNLLWPIIVRHETKTETREIASS